MAGRASHAGTGDPASSADPADPGNRDDPIGQQLAWLLRELRRRDARRRGCAERTYRQLAAETGWSLGIIAQYFAGKVLPPTDRLEVLTGILGATPAERGALATVRDRAEEKRRQVPPRRRAPRSVLPRQLPPPHRYFTGRAMQLEALSRLADEVEHGMVIAVIDGTAGVGKTAAALTWAHRSADRFPDGQLYADLHGFRPDGAKTVAADAVRWFLDALDVPPERVPASMEAQVALYRSLLVGRRVLIVLDNAASADQVRPLLPSTAGCMVLVTSRNELTGLVGAEGAWPLTLSLFTPDEAADLLARRLGAGRTAAEPSAVAELIARCARLPLALSIVATRAATRPELRLADLVRELHGPPETKDSLDAFDGGEHTTNLRTVFSWSYRQLGSASARLFRLLGLRPGGELDAAAMASLSGEPAHRVRPAVAELVRAHLVTEVGRDRYAVHDLLTVYAAELCRRTDPADHRIAAIHRVVDHYLHTAFVAGRLLNPGRETVALPPRRPGTALVRLTDSGRALGWLLTEHPALVVAIDRAVDAGLDTHAWQLTWVLDDICDKQGHWREIVGMQRTALAAAERLNSLVALAAAHRGLGRALAVLGEFHEADKHLRRSLELYLDLDDKVGQAHAYLNLGGMFAAQGRQPEAFELARRALALYQECGHRGGQARALNNLGFLSVALGNYASVIEYCRQSAALHARTGDRNGQAHVWTTLGLAEHHHRGDHARAVTLYRRALRMFRDLGNDYRVAAVLDYLGDAFDAAGESAQAREAWKGALEILDRTDHPDAQRIRSRLLR